MKFPINAEKIHREIILLINDAYHAGAAGKPNIFLKYEDEIREFSANLRKEPSPVVRDLIACIVKWGEEAYRQGRQDAREVGA